MKDLSIKTKLWVKGVHIFFACGWVGTSMSMVLITFIKTNLLNGNELYGVLSALKLIDDLIIIPAAIGCLLTGLIFSLWTKWGFFKFYWVTVKWVITIILILSGIVFLGPWLNGMIAVANENRLTILVNPIFISYRQFNIIFGSLQCVTTIFLVFLSILKPWGKRGK